MFAKCPVYTSIICLSGSKNDFGEGGEKQLVYLKKPHKCFSLRQLEYIGSYQLTKGLKF